MTSLATNLSRPRHAWRSAAFAAALTLTLAAPARADVGDAAPYGALLGRYVKDGGVDYAGLKTETAALDAWVAAAAKADLAGASREEKLAFWINVYNAATLQLVLRHHGRIRSIRDIDEPWKKPKWRVAGETLSLDQMEHEKLRRDLGDPRVHFALVCAARSCPPLRGSAWTAAGIDDQLDEAARRFLASKGGAQTELRDGKPVLKLSKLFEWYAGDFEKGGRTAVDWVARYAPTTMARFLAEHRGDLAVEFLDYDWSLNAR